MRAKEELPDSDSRLSPSGRRVTMDFLPVADLDLCYSWYIYVEFRRFICPAVHRVS